MVVGSELDMDLGTELALELGLGTKLGLGTELDVGSELELGLGSRLLSRLGTKLELGSGFLSGRMAQTALCRLSSRRTPSHSAASRVERQPSQRWQL